ncbi:MAG: hypothetical protein GX610_11930, partial [Rhodococcus sp.]|nr:hypothetical protein [Rhodococcus sp. (in: high G+C Gram-positive bacteria)]
KRIGEHFGKLVPGIFTDEPNHGAYFQSIQDTNSGNAVPWTDTLPKVFSSRYGYDVRDHLAELFFDVDGQPITPARHDYHDCTTHLFSHAFGRQVGQWCGENNLLCTGHLLSEPTCSSQTTVVGSCMRFLEHMQAPGMDLLTQVWREYDTAKQVASAARQFGRKWRLTETYGCTGWDFPFAAHKALGDWQAALGINLRCQHLSWYTMEGEAKRDYPASISYQSPWWSFYAAVEDYFARIHVLTSRGEEIRDVLVVHPVESSWMLCRAGWAEEPQVKARDRMLIDLRDTLLAANIDFDYGDEDILARHGSVLRRGGRCELKVGKAAYTTVVVPPTITLRSSTLSLLEKFADAGGTVVFAGAAPEYVDAVASSAGAELAQRCVRAPAVGAELVDAVAATGRRVSVTDSAGEEIPHTLYMLREDRDAFHLLLVNTGHDFRNLDIDTYVVDRTDALDDVRVRLWVDSRGKPLELDPTDGAVYSAESRKESDGWTIRTSLPAIGSRLFSLPKSAGGKRHPA